VIRTTSEVPTHKADADYWTLDEGPPRTGDCIHVMTSTRWRSWEYITLVVEATEYCVRATDLQAAIVNALNTGA